MCDKLSSPLKTKVSLMAQGTHSAWLVIPTSLHCVQMAQSTSIMDPTFVTEVSPSASLVVSKGFTDKLH